MFLFVGGVLVMVVLWVFCKNFVSIFKMVVKFVCFKFVVIWVIVVEF